jgi:thiol:disulfide interchange protein DsbD
MTSVGVGMALPYALLSAFPQAARSFPRTGPASELVKQAMAFPLIGTAAWLIGPRLVGDPQHWWLVVIVAIWGGAFVLVRSAQILKSSTGLLITSLISVLIVSGTIWTALQFNGGFGTSKSTVASDRLSLNDWNAYSDDILAQALSTNRPVIVKFTASWCANCQVIEATVFRDAATLSALREREAILIKADLTRSEAPGWAKLNALGFTGIPLTAIYLPGKQDKPILLDSLYTSRDILAAIPEVAR